MSFLISKTLIYAIPLMIVALAGVFSERSGIINLALEGIMIFGAFVGALTINLMQQANTFHIVDAALDMNANWGSLQLFLVLIMLMTAVAGALFSLLLAFAAINLKADQTIGGTALNMLSPALVCFFIRLIAQQSELRMYKGDAASWFMVKKTMLGFDKSQNLGFLGETFLNKVYLTTYIIVILFVVLSILLYKTRFGLRLRAYSKS